MTAKKFPTPNLDEWFRGDTGSAKLMFDAAYADIALAVEADRKSLLTFAPDLIVTIGTDVEAARVEVPEDVLGSLLMGLHRAESWERMNTMPGQRLDKELEEIATARRWLESLRPAKASGPVEKRCGTCAHWERLLGGGPLGACLCPVPYHEPSPMDTCQDRGADCPCWKART